MLNPAITDDLVARWRPLSAQEETNGQTFLDDAWRMLNRRLPALAEAAIEDPDLLKEARRVMATAVLRVMKNPDGKRQESIDDYSWQRDKAVSAGLLYFTDDEIGDLIPGESTSGAFSINSLGVGYPGSRFES